ncbi:unnamed protein product [Adineta steineri]|uniref:MAM domain-containing protein n=1 Tax=Adineta steineri TaxID=433720 RepID=A0A816DQV0_9BILA|nr:unnamed protein product [Adineta steineri]CAF1637759.1 unnamed protein product [Adineta steineri]
MRKQISSILIVLLHTFILCRSQIINYQCNFDTNPLAGACQFTTPTGGNAMTSDPGQTPAGSPKQPLTDAKSISSPTMPNNEYCELPYRAQGINFDMYFCRRFSATNSTCPTKSGTGQCNAGRLGLIRLPTTTGLKDLTYTANVDGSTNSEQCLDFYYYITDNTANAKIQIEWESHSDTALITVVTAVASENKWQRKQVSFMGPSSSYEIRFQVGRNAPVADFNFAFDEMYIYDDSCDAIPTTTIPNVSTVVIDTTTTKVVEPATTTGSTTSGSITTGSTTSGSITTGSPTTGSTPARSTTTGSTSAGSTTTGSPTTGSTSTGSTTTGSATTPNMPTDTDPNLALILPLAVGIPVSLGIIGSIIYYFKIIKSKHKINVNSTNTTNDIPLVTPNNTTDNNTTVDALVV